jgi:3-phosphoshikimate 1-carboxyvinyltransferase
MAMTSEPPRGAGGTPRRIPVPGDKSLTHRALLLAALATGRSRIRRPLRGADTAATASALVQLGCAVPEWSDELIVDGAGLHGLREPGVVIDCGNSGTTARLLMGILAGYPFAAVLDGDASLRSRPMRRVTTPLATMGARFDELGAADRLPTRVRGGSLRAVTYDSPHASAQVKSAVLLAALTAGVAASVTEPILSRDHTERMLERLGVPLLRHFHQDGRAQVSLTPVTQLDPLDFDVPGDFSSAAFVLAFATLAAPCEIVVPGVGMNPTRTGFLQVLERMGGQVDIRNPRDSCGEPIADLHVQRARLVSTRIMPEEVPSLVDEIPALAVLAARADGETVIEGAGELRVKESDRITAMVSNLRAIGVEAEERSDGMVIRGTDRPLAGAVRVLHDHRIAMSFGLLAAAGNNDVQIDDPAVVVVSYPAFWSMLQEVVSP